MSAPLLTSVGMTDATTIEIQFDQAMAESGLTDAANYLITPEPPGPDQIAAKAIGSSAVRLLLPTDLKSGGQYQLQVIKLKNKLGESISDQASSLFTGIGNPPVFVSASAASKLKILVEFSEPMDPDLLVKPSLWSVVSLVTGKAVKVSGVSLVDDGDGFFRKAELSISSKMTEDGEHLVTGLGFTDASGNPQSTGDSIEFLGIADLPKMIGAELDAANPKILNLEFDSPLDRAFASAIGSWRVESAGVLPRVYISKAQVSENRQAVRLSVSESKNGSLYAAQASALVIDDYGNQLDPAHSYKTFYGQGEPPTLERWSWVSKNRVDVYFSEPMLDGAEIRNPARYTLDNGASVIDVLSVEGRIVKLVTSNVQPGVEYTLTIA